MSDWMYSGGGSLLCNNVRARCRDVVGQSGGRVLFV